MFHGSRLFSLDLEEIGSIRALLGPRIAEIVDGGLVSKWNAEHGADRVQVGDRIAELDGKRLTGGFLHAIK